MPEDPVKNYFTQLVINHPIVWFWICVVLVAFTVLSYLADFFPKLQSIKATLLTPVAKRFKHKRLVKMAVKYDIQGRVNQVLSELKKELPKDWIKDMEIEWVRSENKADLLDEDEIVLRVRPLENQAHNFVNATYLFLKRSFFPKTKQVIPAAHHEGSVIYVCQKIIKDRGDEMKTVFEDNILEPAIQKNKKLMSYIEDYTEIDKRGFYSGAFLREIHEVAKTVKFTSQRGNVGSEANDILKHIKDFISAYDSAQASVSENKDDHLIPSKYWSKVGPISSYSFLLVARPMKVKLGVNGYVARAKEKKSQGVERLYVFGNSHEKAFFNQVVSAIQAEVTDLEMVEKFETAFDYRGASSGLAALFVARS